MKMRTKTRRKSIRTAAMNMRNLNWRIINLLKKPQQRLMKNSQDLPVLRKVQVLTVSHSIMINNYI